ncbi:riboflavin synthase [Companilactobacillus mishanensis]|uniref:Riboflavin synthase n=1 Tax=Companilactobacillus mishanensis TaxID=2486008 RepID=A0ABW9P9M4_9LACO|nr:riboflavin synthase [Companilactobacillus mishanensis]MQS45871.1 riboflavin synthase [Companilactobacillus mishanensis]
MFTGIIKDVGTVSDIKKKQETFELSVKLHQLSSADMNLGNSIAINGTCLTVIEKLTNGFKVEAMPETFRRTNLGNLEINDHVDIEPALGASDKLDGHFVLGHVDTTMALVDKQTDQNSSVLTFKVPEEYCKYIVEKGSVAIDGVSLTVSSVGDDTFQVSLIPFTLEHTVLGKLKINQTANLEVDILGKYILDSKVGGYDYAK